MAIPASAHLTSYEEAIERSNVESVCETHKYFCYATLC